MYFTESVSILIAGIFSSSMANCFMGIPPLFESVVDSVLIGVDEATPGNELFYYRLDSLLLDIVKKPQIKQPIALHQSEHRRFFTFHCASATGSLKPAPAWQTPSLPYFCGLPLMPSD